MSTRRSLVFAVVALCTTDALVSACATNDGGEGRGAVDPGPDVDSAADATAEASPDATPCTDCENFPAACAPDIFCPNKAFAAMDARSKPDPRTDFFVVRGRSANDVWVAGAVGTVARFDGASWTRSDLGTTETQRTLWLHDSGEIVFGRFTSIYSRGLGLAPADPDAGVSSGGWLQPAPPPAPSSMDPLSQTVRSSWFTPGSNTLWVASWGNSIWPAPSGLWRLHYAPAAGLELLEGVSPTVCADLGCGEMYAIHGASPGTLWAVGGAGVVVRIEGADAETPTAKSFNSRTTYALRGVWAASDADVWVVGATGTIRHYTGDNRLLDIVEDVPTRTTLNAVWGTSASDVWAVGDAGVVLHYDGKSWSRVKVAGFGSLRPNLHAVWSPSPGHVWIGGQGVVLSLGGEP